MGLNNCTCRTDCLQASTQESTIQNITNNITTVNTILSCDYTESVFVIGTKLWNPTKTLTIPAGTIQNVNDKLVIKSIFYVAVNTGIPTNIDIMLGDPITGVSMGSIQQANTTDTYHIIVAETTLSYVGINLCFYSTKQTNYLGIIKTVTMTPIVSGYPKLINPYNTIVFNPTMPNTINYNCTLNYASTKFELIETELYRA